MTISTTASDNTLKHKLDELAREVAGRRDAEQQLQLRNELLQTQKELLEAIVQGAELNLILRTLVDTVQQQSHTGAIVSILLLDDAGTHLSHAIASDLPAEYARMIDGLAIGPQVGSCGTAAFTRKPVFVGDILDHPFWAPFREAAIVSGMRACWSSPILSQDQAVLGTFAVYYPQPFPDISRDVHLVELCTRTAAVAIQRALSERRREATEQALRRSESLAAAGRLAATVAHEVNNPLEAITNLIYLARTDPDIPERVRETLNTADREIARVSHIAHRTVGFYRDTTEARDIDLSALVEDVLELYARKITNKDLLVEPRIEPGVTVWAAEGEVRQVIGNLVANAIDACDDGARIRVRVKHAHQDGSFGATVTVSDSGCGIPPEVRARIFDPFFTTKANAGTGLGLWVSKGITDKHGGTLGFHSSLHPERRGTVFKLFLPRHAAEPAVKAAEGSHA